jgi:hypothetical protein
MGRVKIPGRSAADHRPASAAVERAVQRRAVESRDPVAWVHALASSRQGGEAARGDASPPLSAPASRMGPRRTSTSRRGGAGVLPSAPMIRPPLLVATLAGALCGPLGCACGPARKDPPPAPNEAASLAPRPAPAPPAASTAKAAAAKSEQRKRMIITLRPDERARKAPEGEVRYEPDRRRQSAHYTTYVLDRAELAKTVGEAKLEKELEVEVEVLEDTSETRSPGKPSMPSPSGGFTFRTIRCRVTRLIAAKLGSSVG